jgi:tripartite-type tricarboxylate transporter receptor subunit TctC
MRAISGLTAAVLLTSPAVAADYYAGKTIELVVGHYVGGGYDIYARALARHYGRHIPGNPTIVVKNMPGAGSAKAGQFISAVAPKDGTVIGAVTPGAIMSALLDGRNETTFDPTKVSYVGTSNNGTRICVLNKEAKAQRFEDMLTEKTVIGAAAVNDATHDYAFMVRNMTGAQLNIVPGYKGTSDIGLAMERREIDGSCGWDWASFKSQRGAWVREGRVKVLVQMGLGPDEELSKLGAPPIWGFIKSEDDRKAIELVVSQQVFHRPYIAPPGIPALALETLRTAFNTTVKDPQFLADAEKTGIDILPLGGAQIQELVHKLAGASESVVERAKRAIRP